MVEMYSCSRFYMQGGSRRHDQTVVDEVGPFGGKPGIGGEGFAAFDNHVLPVGGEFHILLHTVGEKDNRIDNEDGVVLVGGVDVRFDKDIEAVFSPNLHVGELVARHTIDIDVESRPLGIGQFDGRDVERFFVGVVDTERTGRGAYRGKHGVERYRVGRERQYVRRICGEIVVYATGEEAPYQQGQSDKRARYCSHRIIQTVSTLLYCGIRAIFFEIGSAWRGEFRSFLHIVGYGFRFGAIEIENCGFSFVSALDFYYLLIRQDTVRYKKIKQVYFLCAYLSLSLEDDNL